MAAEAQRRGEFQEHLIYHVGITDRDTIAWLQSFLKPMRLRGNCTGFSRENNRS